MSVKTIGDRLRSARERKVWSQSELAERSGVAKVTITRIESGWSGKRPYPKTLRRLAEALGVDPAWLRDGEEARGR